MGNLAGLTRVAKNEWIEGECLGGVRGVVLERKKDREGVGGSRQ